MSVVTTTTAAAAITAPKTRHSNPSVVVAAAAVYDPFDHLFDADDDDDDDDIFQQSPPKVSSTTTSGGSTAPPTKIDAIKDNVEYVNSKMNKTKKQKKPKSSTTTAATHTNNIVLLDGGDDPGNTPIKRASTADVTLHSSRHKSSSSPSPTLSSPPPATTPIKRKELEIVGYPWGRNKTYASSAVCRFLVEKIIRNDIFPGALPRDIPINALYELPTYSPFMEFHLVVAFDESNSRDVTASGTHIFTVVKIVSCSTRLINERTMREYLIRLYNCSNGRLYDTSDMKTEDRYSDAATKRRRQDDQDDRDHILKKRLSMSGDGSGSSSTFKLEKTSALLQSTLSAEFLGKTMSRIAHKQRRVNKPLATPGQVWYKKYVYPLIRHWPKNGLTLDNVEQYLKQLYNDSKKFQVALNQSTSATTSSMSNRASSGGDSGDSSNSFSDIYTIIYSKIKPCLRGTLFEHMLIYFHESFLHALSPSQQLAIYYLMNEKPEIMMFWRMTLFYLSLVKHIDPSSVHKQHRQSHSSSSSKERAKEDDNEESNSSHINLFHNNRDIDIQTSSRRKDYANFKDRLLSMTRLYYDPTMPMWSIAKYQMFMDARKSTTTTATITTTTAPISQQTLFSALEIFLNVDQHYYYSGNTAIPYFVTPDLFRGNAFYCDVLSSRNRPGLEFLLREKIFVLCKNTMTAVVGATAPPRMMQPLNFYAEEEKLVQLLARVQHPLEPLLLIDSNFWGSFFLKRLTRVIKDLSDAFQSGARASFKPDGSPEPVSIRIYSCNEQVARYQSVTLNLKVSSIFDDSIFVTRPPPVSQTTTPYSTTHLIILSAHKIPMNRISQLIEKLSQENDGRQFTIVLCTDSEDFTNRNYKNHTFISFHGLDKLPSATGISGGASPRFKYDQWKIESLRHELSDQSKSTRKSVDSYLCVKQSKQAKLNEISLKNFKEIIKCYKDLEKEYIRDPLNDTYVILCSNEPTKKRLLTLMFEDKKKTYAQFSFLCKNYVFIEQSNTRGKIQQAFLIEDDKSNSEVATTQVMDIRRNEHLIKVADRFYSTEKTSVEHSSFELVSNYSGPPVKTVVFVVSERTSRHDLLVAAKYATDSLKIYYSYNTSFATLVDSTMQYHHQHTSDFSSKLTHAFQ